MDEKQKVQTVGTETLDNIRAMREAANKKQGVLIIGGDMADGSSHAVVNVDAVENAIMKRSGGIRPSDRISVVGARTPLSRSMLFGAVSMNLFADAQGREVIPIIEDMHHSTIRPNDHMVGDRVVRSACDIYATRDTSGAAERRAKRKTQKKARKASRRK